MRVVVVIGLAIVLMAVLNAFDVSWVVFAIVASALGGAFAIGLVRFNLKRMHIKRAAEAASDEALDAVWREIESLSDEPPTAAILVRTNGTPHSDASAISIPSDLRGFPWAGWTLHCASEEQLELRKGAAPDGCSGLAGLQLRSLLIPRFKTKSGKFRNAYAPSKYLQRSRLLRGQLAGICERYPEELLGHLLSLTDTFEFDALRQVRISGSPGWAQTAAFRSCPTCGRKAQFVVQIPGELLPSRRRSRPDACYVYSCRHHPTEVELVVQYT